MSQFNTIAGWVLAGGIVALGASIVTGEVWHAERPEKMGYVVEGVVEEGGEEDAGPSIEQALQTATAEQGEAVFARCRSCHTVNQGGADGIGPNLYGIMGAQIAAGSFAYSDALAGIGGSWGWNNMSDWLTRPSAFAQGTKMSFAGLSDVNDRAAVMLYMNAQGSSLPLPPPPAAEEPAEEDGPGDDAVPAEEVEDAVDNEGDGAGAVEE
ncbi:MAG: cytochrome c family protein [Parasphingopyxis sp.]|nr:c-type cytochrome [Sphingomonadales bacterium]